MIFDILKFIFQRGMWRVVYLLLICISYKVNVSLSQTNYTLGPDGNIRVYLVNLERRHERFLNCDKQLKHFGLNYTRFLAFDTHHMKHRQYDKIPKLHPKFKFDLKAYLSKPSSCSEGCGPVGCWLSHTQIHFMIEDDYEQKGIDGPVLILEDDIRIEERALTVINEAINTLPPTWELFAVGYKNEYCSGPVAHTTIDARDLPAGIKYCRARLFLDTHAYILRNVTAIRHFLQYENRDSPEAIDLIWVPLNENLQIESYLLRPGPVINQNKDFISDIQPNENAKNNHRRLRIR